MNDIAIGEYVIVGNAAARWLRTYRGSEGEADEQGDNLSAHQGCIE